MTETDILKEFPEIRVWPVGKGRKSKLYVVRENGVTTSGRDLQALVNLLRKERAAK
jgi:hypothetical protein